MAESGGRGGVLGFKPASPPAKGSRGVLQARPVGSGSKLRENVGFGAFRGSKNQALSTFQGRLAVFSLSKLCKIILISQSSGVHRPLQRPLNDAREHDALSAEPRRPTLSVSGRAIGRAAGGRQCDCTMYRGLVLVSLLSSVTKWGLFV